METRKFLLGKGETSDPNYQFFWVPAVSFGVCVSVCAGVRGRFFIHQHRGSLAATISQLIFSGGGITALHTLGAGNRGQSEFLFLRLEDPPGEMFELYKWLALRDFVCLFVFFVHKRADSMVMNDFL